MSGKRNGRITTNQNSLILQGSFKDVHHSLKNEDGNKDDPTNTCKKCSKTFVRPRSLANHHQRCSQIKKYACLIQGCGVKFRYKAELERHGSVHTGVKPFLCAVCAKSFRTKSLLNRHVLHSHDPVTSAHQQCSLCDKTLAASSMRNHLKAHMSDNAKPYVCGFCGARFKVKKVLTRHERTHTGEKPYRCKVCFQQFADRSGVITHTRTHTGERPYACTLCQQSFRRSTHLKDHLRTHSNATHFECELCGTQFKYKSSFRRHKLSHQGIKQKNYHKKRKPSSPQESGGKTSIASNVHQVRDQDSDEDGSNYLFDLSVLDTEVTIVSTSDTDSVNPHTSSQITPSKQQMFQLREIVPPTTTEGLPQANAYISNRILNTPRRDSNKYSVQHSESSVLTSLSSDSNDSQQQLEVIAATEALSQNDAYLSNQIFKTRRKYFNSTNNRNLAPTPQNTKSQNPHFVQQPSTLQNVINSLERVVQDPARFVSVIQDQSQSKSHTNNASILFKQQEQVSSKKHKKMSVSSMPPGGSEQLAPEVFSTNQIQLQSCTNINSPTGKNRRAVSTKPRPYVCSTCGDDFTENRFLKEHVRIHTGEKPHQCDFCSERFRTFNLYKRHRMVHTGERPYKCKYCPKDFKDLSGVTHHERMHSGVRPYSCQYCSKSFTRSTHLTSHYVTHSTVQHHNCQKCGQNFKYAKSLKRHLKNKHIDPKGS